MLGHLVLLGGIPVRPSIYIVLFASSGLSSTEAKRFREGRRGGAVDANLL